MNYNFEKNKLSVKKKILLWSMFFAFSFWFVFALADEYKAEILKNFKEKQYDLIFKSDITSFTDQYDDIFSISRKIDLYNDLYSEVVTDKERVEQLNREVYDQILSLEDSIAALDLDIEKTSSKVKQINEEVIQIKNEIEVNTKTIEILRNKINENKEILLEYLVYIYKKSNTSYTETEIDNLKSILLNWENISDLIDDLYFKWIIQVTGNRLIENHKNYISQLYLKKIDLDNKELNLKGLRKQLIIEKKILDDKKEFKESLLVESKWQQAYYEEYLDNKIKLEEKLKIETLKEKIRLNTVREKILDKYECDYVDLSVNTIEVRALEKNDQKCYNINRMIYSETQLNESVSFTKENNPFLWPVNPSLWLSSYYQDEEYNDTLWAEHNAIDIRVPQWTSVLAPMDWYVVYVNKPDSKDYSFVVLKHYDWYITVYWHLSEVLVDEYEYVEAGQIFAKSGWEFGTNWAWYITTWPHLHLEVFKDKEYIDPLSVLDLSYLSIENLDSKYASKYQFDFNARRWFMYNDNWSSNSNTFYLLWTNEIERQKYLIDKYAVDWFDDWQMWVDESIFWNIDPSLTMCIWLAESTMWLNMTTSYNIGNVWNNDRWDREHLSSPREWISLIVSTLNNRYFRDIDELYKLSWAWRKEYWDKPCTTQWEFCYATDTNNWHNNVTKCLTHLKARYIPDDYNFRILK